VTGLNPIAVERVVAPRSIEEVQRLLRETPGPISISGARHSMGGQIGTEGALVLDMRELDDVIDYRPAERWIRVEAGITWRQIQARIDPDDLAVAIMQSYANFTVGGSLSVNAHGRYVNRGPLIGSVRSISVVLADGSLVEASRDTSPELFFGAIGGYGGLGVIVSATLELERNAKLERKVATLSLADYPAHFREHVLGDPKAVFHNADLYPPTFSNAVSITYAETDRDVTESSRLQPDGRHYWLSPLVYFGVSELPYGKQLREDVIDPFTLPRDRVVWRNFEASYDARALEPFSRERGTYVLEEYFVPVRHFGEFAAQLAEIFQRYDANVINVSIRHATPDPGTYLAWAREECFAFVVYYKQGTQPAQRTEVGVWTRELIDAVLALDGTYYLPYQIHARDDQFHAAYPRAKELFALKAKLDPTYKLRNKLWDRYLPPADESARRVREAQLHGELAALPGYHRDENQTFLTLPEWYIVYSADEQAALLREGRPSQFPWFRSIGQFWSAYRHSARATREGDPTNYGYHVMIGVIGTSFSVEYAAKGAYEATLGRLSEWASLDAPDERTAEDEFQARVAADYASFIHETPWYAYPFWTRLSEYWSGPDDARGWSLRRMERQAALTLDLATRAGYGKLLGGASGAAYAPEDLQIQAWLRGDPEAATRAWPGVSVVKTLGEDDWLASIPRYEKFTGAVAALAASGARFVEVAGNRVILITVIAPRDWDGGHLFGDVVHEWPILTQSERKRVALRVPVASLHRIIPALASEGAALDHVYDY